MAVLGRFKGHPTITLNPESKYPFSFGLEKAKLVLADIEAIRRFVIEHGSAEDRARQDAANSQQAWNGQRR